MHIAGQVQAGDVTFVGDAKGAEVPVSEKLFERSPFWPVTTGSTVLVEVVGNSMEPDYLPGDIIAVRPPTSQRDVPEGAPVLITTGLRAATFKIFHRTKHFLVGEPLNREHPFIVLGEDDDANVSHIVLAKIDFNRRNAPVSAPSARAKRRRF